MRNNFNIHKNATFYLNLYGVLEKQCCGAEPSSFARRQSQTFRSAPAPSIIKANKIQDI